jgi:uncharacterized protein (TIGR00251 family)
LRGTSSTTCLLARADFGVWSESPVIQATPNGIVLDIRVVPRAGRSGVAGTRGDALVVRLGAAPVEGAANEELVEVIADLFDVPKRAVAIVAGVRSRKKRVSVAGVDLATASSRLPR